MTPQQRSRDWLKKNGWIFGTVEQTIHIPSKSRPGAKEIFKRDLFGFCDLCGVHPDHFGTRFIQVTTSSNKTARLEKMKDLPAIKFILAAGNTVELHCWAKKGARGARKLWTLDRFQARMVDENIHWEKQNEGELDHDFEQQLSLAVQ